MDDIICISSSPPVSPKKARIPPPKADPKPSKPSKASTDFFSVDGLDFSSEADFPEERPSKRRRSNSPTGPISRIVQNVDAELILSSDFDIPSSSAPVRSIARRPDPRKSKEVDDIEFSSSAPQAGSKRTAIYADAHDLSSDGIAEEPRPVFSDLVMKVLNSSAVSQSKTDSQKPTGERKLARSTSNRQPSSKGQKTDLDAIESSSQAPKASQRSLSQPKASKPDPVKSKEAKQQAKLEREREKQLAKDLAEVNKSKANKKETSKEMILEMPGSLEDKSVGNQVMEYMRQHEVRVVFKDEETTLSDDAWLYTGKILQWKRKLEATYDENEGQWKPLDKPKIEKEPHVAVFLNGLDFATIAAGSSERPDLSTMKSNFDRHVKTLRERHPSKRLIYLVQGLHAWVKKNENSKNREYAAAVRAEVEESASQPKKRKQKATPTQLLAVTADMAEDLQLHLQVNHQPIVIHHTTSDAATASQILSFTQSLSTRPYRIAELEYNLRSASFYMGSGQFKTGDDAQETFARMLEEQQRVTPSIAQSIVAQYSSPRELVAAFRRKDNLMLENMRKSTNKDGGYSDKRIGPVISKRMHKVFLGRDPDATSGMS